jgi:general secretion pathway protein A
MYASYWGLREKPFENTPDPRFFYASQQHREAEARMLYCIRERKGAGLLTGVFGCGKTVVGQVVLKELNQERYRTAVLTNPRLNDLDLLRLIAHYLGASPLAATKADVLIQLEMILTENAKEGRDSVVLIDEAHTIQSPEVFEELRLLLNCQWQQRFLLTLLLFGQPELARNIDQNKPLEQRIGVKASLGPMSFEETSAYVVHRLRVAGHEEPGGVFSYEALRVVHDSTGGIPRRVNRLCDMLLLAGMGARTARIEPPLVQEEVAGLQTA